MKTIAKPWGHIEIFANTNRYAGKKLYICHGEKLSRHIHKYKDETWLINKGRIIATLGDKFIMMKEGDTVDIPHGTIHRAEALLDTEIIEWCTPEKRDWKRLEDKYGRLQERAGE